MTQSPSVLIIACGALGRELVQLIRANAWESVKVQCLPADLHNRPERIPEAVRAKIQAARGRFDQMFVAYGDCGTGGLLDQVLQEEGVERLPGNHCYEFFAGSQVFNALAEAELGTFYLTDFLTRHFQRLIYQGLGLEKHPELASLYFEHYRKVVYLAQTEDPVLLDKAKAAAETLGLKFEYRYTGYGDLEQTLVHFHGRLSSMVSPAEG